MLIKSDIITVNNINDTIASDTEPLFPLDKQQWLDTSTTPAILKIYDVNTNSWLIQTMDITQLDSLTIDDINRRIEQAGSNSGNINYYGTTEPETANEGDLFFKYDSNDLTHCIGMYIYTGGAWQLKKLDNNALTVGNLSALSANLGDITAGTLRGVQITLGAYDGTTGHYPFEANADGSTYMSKLTVNSTTGTPVYNFVPYVLVDKGIAAAYSRILRQFDNQGVTKNAYYDVVASIEDGTFRARALSKHGTPDGTDSDFDLWNSRSLFMNERGLTTSSGIFKGTVGVGSSRYIDFWPGENGYNNTDTSMRGMEIFSGAAMSITGGTSSLSFDINAGGDLSINAGGNISVVGNGFYFNMKDLYVNGSGGGTLNSGTNLTAGGLVTNGKALFMGVNTYLHVTDMAGYNNGNGYTYKPIKSGGLYSNFMDTNTGTNIYLRPTSTGEARVTESGTTDAYRPIKASAFTNSSSYELKQDITEMNRNALDIVDATKVYEYRYISDVEAGIFEDWKIGLIAEYSPQVATLDMSGIDVYKMASMLWKATQELYQQNKGLELSLQLANTDIEDLKTRISALENVA